MLVDNQPLRVPAMKAASVHRAGSSDQEVTLKGGKKEISSMNSSVAFCLDKIPGVEERKTAEAMKLD